MDTAMTSDLFEIFRKELATLMPLPANQAVLEQVGSSFTCLQRIAI